MAKTKWRAREFTPKQNQNGTHSFYGEAVIATDIDNQDLALKVQARTGVRAYEAQAVIAAIAEIVAEEVLESSRITLSDNRGVKMVSFYPRVTGSISDKDVQQNPQKYPGKTVAEESMLTPDLLTWNVGASVGIRYSKEFSQNKQAQKVKYVATDVTVADDTETEPQQPAGNDPAPGDNEG